MSVKMKRLPLSERPYEKLEMYGESKLSNSELLAIIIKSGTKEENSISLAQKILSLKGTQSTNSLRFLHDVSINELMQIKGIGKVKAIQIKSICELAKRMSRPLNDLNCVIKSAKDIADLLMDELKYEKREVIKEVLLNSANKIIKIVDITVGGTAKANIDIKDILTEPIKLGVAKIIIVHNHPSGDPTPSKSDFDFTRKTI